MHLQSRRAFDPRLILWGLALFGATSSRLFANVPSTLWKAGDGWPITVEYFPKGDGASGEANATYPIHVVVQAIEIVDKVPCWRLAFIAPSPQSKEIVPKNYRVFVDKVLGKPIAVSLDNVKINRAVTSFGDEKFISLSPRGVPLEVFRIGKDIERSSDGDQGYLRVSAKDSGQEKVWEAVMSLPGQPVTTIRQTWRPNEKWWDRYERFRGDHKELVAIRTISPGVKTVPQKAKELPAKPPAEGFTEKKTFLTELDDDRFDLRKDPRLNATVTWTTRNPTIREVLEKLQACTWVSLTVDEDRILDQRAFEHVNLNSYPAWSLMTKVASSNGFVGRWKRTSDGYRLEDASTASQPFWSKKWGYGALIVSLLVLSLAVLALFVLYKWKEKKEGHGRATDTARSENPS